MARILIESFETQRLGIWSNTSGVSVVSSSGKDMKGNYCAQIGTSSSDCLEKNLASNNEYYFSFLKKSLLPQVFQ